jgi:hypothetical protein
LNHFTVPVFKERVLMCAGRLRRATTPRRKAKPRRPASDSKDTVLRKPTVTLSADLGET